MSTHRYNQFGEQIYEIMEGKNAGRIEQGKRRLSLNALAAAIDMDAAQLSRYLTGEKRPDVHTVVRLLAALAVAPETAEKAIHMAGYDISYDTYPEFGIYREILNNSENYSHEKINEMFCGIKGQNPEKVKQYFICHAEDIKN